MQKPISMRIATADGGSEQDHGHDHDPGNGWLPGGSSGMEGFMKVLRLVADGTIALGNP